MLRPADFLVHIPVLNIRQGYGKGTATAITPERASLRQPHSCALVVTDWSKVKTSHLRLYVALQLRSVGNRR